MANKHNAPPVAPLIRRSPVFKRKFKTPGNGPWVAEFHEDKLVLRKARGRKRFEFEFAKLYALSTGTML